MSGTLDVCLDVTSTKEYTSICRNTAT